MQKNHSGKSFGAKIREKGYYIVLILCVAAVGVSGYLFSKSLSSEKKTASPENDARSVAVTQATNQTDRDALASDDNRAVEAILPQIPEPVLDTVTAVRPVAGEVSQGYCVDRLAYSATMKDWRTHEGLDLQAPLGATVCAAAAGSVEQVMLDDYWGQTVVISHAGGYVTHYSNLAQEVSVAVGDTVTAGQAIGSVGQTAMAEIADEPHLHFSVTKNNVSVDPESFLP